jgi:hypothetical protein
VPPFYQCTPAYRERIVRQMKRKAAELGLVIVEQEAVAQPA